MPAHEKSFPTFFNKKTSFTWLMQWMGIASLLLLLFVYATLTGYSPLIGILLIIPPLYCLFYYRFSFFVTLVFIYTLGFAAFLNLPVTSGGFPVSTAILISAMPLWWLAALLQKDREIFLIFFRRPEHILVTAFLVTMFVSLVNSRELVPAIRQIQLFIYCWLIFYYTQLVLLDRNKLDRAVFWFCMSGLTVGLLGLLEIIIQQPLYWVLGNRSVLMADVSDVVLNAHAGRINGLAGDAPFHGIFMSIHFCLSLYYFMISSRKWTKLFYAAVFSISLINVVLTASRGAVISTILAFLMMWTFLRIKNKWGILIGLSALFVFLIMFFTIFMPEMHIERLYSSEARATDTVSMRFSHIPIAWMMFFDHPILGLGPDGFVTNYTKYAPEFAANAYKTVTMKTHNTPLQILAEYGLVGMFILSSLYILTVKRMWEVLQNSRDQQLQYLALAFLGALVGYLFFLCTSNTLFDKNLWLLIALAQSTYTIHLTLQSPSDGTLSL